MTSRKTLLVAIALGAIALQGAPASAAPDPNGPNGDVMTEEARARFKEGLDLYKQHKNVEARTKYLQALALSQAAQIYLNLAIAEYDLMLYPDALKHAKAYAVHPKADPARVEKMKKEMIPDLAGKTGHLNVEGQAGEAVFVDGDKVGIAPLRDSVDVAPGDHKVACGSITRNVTVHAGDNATVIVVVEQGPAPINTAPVPTTTATATEPPPPPIDNPPQKAEERGMGRWIGPIALGVVGAGGIVTGAVLGSASTNDVNAQKSAAASHPCVITSSQTCTDFQSKGSDANTAATISIIGYSVGGAALLGGVIWSLVNMRSHHDEATSAWLIAPWGGPNGAGANAIVKF